MTHYVTNQTNSQNAGALAHRDRLLRRHRAPKSNASSKNARVERNVGTASPDIATANAGGPPFPKLEVTNCPATRTVGCHSR